MIHKKSKVLLLFLATLGLKNINAQKIKQDIIKFEPLLKLDKLPENLPKIASITIVPVLWDSATLGYSQSLISNNKLAAVPDKNMTDYLQEHVNKQYSKIFDPTGIHLLWIIQELRLNEREAGFWHKGYCRLKANVYSSTDNSNYSLLLCFDTVLVRSAQSDPAIRHDKSIAKALQFLLQKLPDNPTPLSNNSIDKSSILNREKEKFAIPALLDTAINDGLYTSFEEFKLNKPSIKQFITEIDKKKKIVVIYNADSSNSKTPIPGIWGICKNGEVYKYHQQQLIAIEKHGNGFILSDYIETIKRRNGSVFFNSMIWGIVGAVAAYSSFSSKIYLVTAFPYIKEKQPEASSIDMETGELTF